MADTYDVIDVRRADCIDYVTLNRPGVRNAINDHLIDELTRWAEGATHDSTLRMAVLGGAGPSFCSGADPGWRSRTVDLDYEENFHDAWALARLFVTLDTLPVPLVGRVHGAALAGGWIWWRSVTSPSRPRTPSSDART